jgi:hypothetical protein
MNTFAPIEILNVARRIIDKILIDFSIARLKINYRHGLVIQRVLNN